MYAPRTLTWTTSPPTAKQLRAKGFETYRYGEIRDRFIVPARNASTTRPNLENAASGLLDVLASHDRLAILNVPCNTAGDLQDIYGFLVEPAFRRNISLLLGVDRPLEDLDPTLFVAPDFEYDWSLQRLRHVAMHYLRTGGDQPLTPIESMLLDAMVDAGLTPQTQYGIGPYRVDFAFPSHRLTIEADGRGWHDAVRDAVRDAHLAQMGWDVTRFSGSQIYRDAPGCARAVESTLARRGQSLVYSELPDELGPTSWWRRFLDWLLRRPTTSDLLRWPDPPILETAEPQWKAHLDAHQRRAVEAHEGVVQIIAPAGSGKTTTLLTRVQELLSRGIPANRILCTTFNRATRIELEERLKDLGVSSVDVLNFHALGRQILHEEGMLRKDIVRVSHGHWRFLAREAMNEIESGVWLDAPVASEAVSNYKLALMWSPAQAEKSAQSDEERTTAAIYRRYEQHLEESDAHDFDDLIIRPLELLKTDSAARDRWQRKWECVLVDEYQDIEPAQELLIRMIAAPEDSIFAVGDEDQCIYSWRRASVERIVQLDTKYPGLERVVLETTYRCPRTIAEAAAAMIANNKRRFPKVIKAFEGNEDPGEITVQSFNGVPEAARHVAERLAGANDPDEVAVIARTSLLLREVVSACDDLGIEVHAPSRALRASDAEASILSYLRLIASPASASDGDIRQAFRVPNRYLPNGEESSLRVSLAGGKSLSQAIGLLNIPPDQDWRLPKLEEGAALLDELKLEPDAANVIYLLRTRGLLDQHYSSVERMSPHDQIEIEALERLQERAEGKSVAEYLTELETRAARLAGAGSESGIELTTIHGAKGREWDTVILFSADLNQLPHFRALADTDSDDEFNEAIEDERRLAYVAMTRAKQRLEIVVSDKPSPFLVEAGVMSAAAPLPTKAQIDKAASPQNQGASPPAGKPNVPGPIKAKYAGHCPICNKRYPIGTALVKLDSGWAHESCQPK